MVPETEGLGRLAASVRRATLGLLGSVSFPLSFRPAWTFSFPRRLFLARGCQMLCQFYLWSDKRGY